ncbi:MAG: hypothetical protein ACKO6N_00700 [Myxococcota bacterium]
MEHKPHDTLAKLVFSVLAPHREQLPEVELRLPAYGDILLRPGAPLAEATGMLRELVGTQQVLLEFFSARPRLLELVRIRAKGFMSVALELQRDTDFATLKNSRIIIIGNGHPLVPLRDAFYRERWQVLSPGLHWLSGWPEVFYLDLLRLPVTPETAWLHIAGKSVWIGLALELLFSSDSAENEAFISRLSKEVPHMKIERDRGEEAATRRFLTAWEELAALKRGEARGEARGRREAYQHMLRLLLTQRFGDAAEPVLAQLELLSDLQTLETVAMRLLQATSPQELRLD